MTQEPSPQGNEDYSQGICISPYSPDAKGLGAALSHHTSASVEQGILQQNYPIQVDVTRRFNDPRSFVSSRAKQSGKQTVSPSAASILDMQMVLVLRFLQYPSLLDAVGLLGGAEWIDKCEFRAVRSNDDYEWQEWEGQGEDSTFLQCLRRAHENALTRHNSNLQPAANL
jgi:hypothetical protein